MLASPVSPSVSLRSDSSTSTSTGISTAHQSYASPRHPAYLPPASHNPNQASPSASSNTSNNTTSNYSRYTTTSQIERVNEVLVEKVLLQPRAVPATNGGLEHGSALKRLIAFLDGDDEMVEAGRPGDDLRQRPAQQVQYADHQQRYDAQSSQPADSHGIHDRQQAEESASHYTAHERSSSSAHHPSTPPSTRPTYSFPATVNPNPNQQREHAHDRDDTHTPRLSSSVQESRFYPSQGPDTAHAPHVQGINDHRHPRHHEEGQTRINTETQSRAPPPAHHASHYHHAPTAGYSRHNAAAQSATHGPSQSVILSTQAQLDRLKSEVAHLDELVNRLKGQHITPHEGGLHSKGLSHDLNSQQQYTHSQHQPTHEHEHHHQRAYTQKAAPEDEEAILAAQKEAEEAEVRRKIAEYESAPATQSDMLQLIRTLDSLVWMRHSSSPAPFDSTDTSHEGTKRKQNEMKYGKGNRSDDVIFTKGNLDHLTRRMKAWENIVRHKEDEGRYNLVP